MAESSRGRRFWLDTFAQRPRLGLAVAAFCSFKFVGKEAHDLVMAEVLDPGYQTSHIGSSHSARRPKRRRRWQVKYALSFDSPVISSAFHSTSGERNGGWTRTVCHAWAQCAMEVLGRNRARHSGSAFRDRDGGQQGAAGVRLIPDRAFGEACLKTRGTAVRGAC